MEGLDLAVDQIGMLILVADAREGLLALFTGIVSPFLMYHALVARKSGAVAKDGWAVGAAEGVPLAVEEVVVAAEERRGRKQKPTTVTKETWWGVFGLHMLVQHIFVTEASWALCTVSPSKVLRSATRFHDGLGQMTSAS